MQSYEILSQTLKDLTNKRKLIFLSKMQHIAVIELFGSMYLQFSTVHKIKQIQLSFKSRMRNEERMMRGEC